jgi:hypothetical protein
MRQPTRWAVALSTGAVLLTGAMTGAGAAQAASTTGPDQEMPFPCSDRWTGSSRYNHSPSSLSIDWNRTNDVYDHVVASAAGVVTRVVNLGNRSYGKYIIVDHGGGRTSLYAHLYSQWVTQGQAVDQGQIIGLVGSTGGSTGPHLHYEQRLNDRVQTSYFHRASFRMGSTQTSLSCPDVPVIGDWDGNKASNIGIMRRGTTSAFSLKRPKLGTLSIAFGRATDEPVSGDWDGDGTTDVGVRRPGWKAFLLRGADGKTTQLNLGRVRDVGVTGDWDGDKITDVGVWAPETRVFTLRKGDGRLTRVTLGALGDRPVTGDWNADGVTDLGVFTPATATFTLRSVATTGAVTTTKVKWGKSTDLPVAGDWNADGIGDVGVWDPATALFSLRLTPKVTNGRVVVRQPKWGLARG